MWPETMAILNINITGPETMAMRNILEKKNIVEFLCSPEKNAMWRKISFTYNK